MNRISLLKVGVGVAFLLIGARLFQVQILEHEDYVARASAEHVKKFDLPARRGEIYAMDGDKPVPVVMNETVYTMFVDPKTARERGRVEQVVAKIVPEEKRVGNWGEAWADPENQYYVVGRGLTRQEAEAVKGEELAGVGFSATVKRNYPRDGLAAQTLGFVNAEGVGQYGVEGAYDEELSGTDGVLQTVTDVNLVPLNIGDENVRVPAVDGEDVVLSLDTNVQGFVERALEHGIERTGGTYASAVVMNPRTGEVMAMANLPSYDPSKYGEVEDPSVYQNAVLRATYDVKSGKGYEPASVCKVLTFATGVDRGTLKPSDTYNNAGYVELDGFRVNNANKGHLGEISFQDVLDYSLNTGSIEALRRFDPASDEISRKARDVLYEYYHDRFGLGRATGVELAEDSGWVLSPDEVEGSGPALSYANMTFGQGLAVSMLQIAGAYSAIANGGEYYTPTVVAGEMREGVFVPAGERKAERRAVSESTSEVMRGMLVAARNRVGLPKVDPVGYKIGAKSGTAETIGDDGKYTMKTTVATYAGFGGGELPEYVIVVRIGGDGKNLDGWEHASPIWTEISNYLIEYLGILPE